MNKKNQFDYKKALRENFELLKQKAQQIKDFANETGDERPYVIFATIRIDGREKSVLKKYGVDVYKMHLNNSHRKPSSMVNLERLGKYPIDFWFPDFNKVIEDAKRELQDNSNTVAGILKGISAISLEMGGDPYAEVRSHLIERINALFNNMDHYKQIEENTYLKAELEKLKKQLEKKSSKKEESKDEDDGDDEKDSEVTAPKLSAKQQEILNKLK